MANTGSTGAGRRAAGLRRRCGAVTRADLVTLFVAAMLCSASYCLAIWHNSRGAADSRVLGSSAVLAAAASCGGDEPLDFEAHHSAEAAGLSVSSPSSTTNTRRALCGAAVPGSTGYRSAFTRFTTTAEGWAGLGGSLGFTNTGDVRA